MMKEMKSIGVRIILVRRDSSSPDKFSGDEGREGTGVSANSSNVSAFFFFLCRYLVACGDAGGLRGLCGLGMESCEVDEAIVVISCHEDLFWWLVPLMKAEDQQHHLRVEVNGSVMLLRRVTGLVLCADAQRLDVVKESETQSDTPRGRRHDARTWAGYDAVLLLFVGWLVYTGPHSVQEQGRKSKTCRPDSRDFEQSLRSCKTE